MTLASTPARCSSSWSISKARRSRRIEKGPLPIDQALEYGAQIAEALAVAHRAGIVHRDLKPGNVMLTKSGAKLLDFGVAKLKGHGEHSAAAQFGSMPTGTAPLTGEGVIVGTLHYMAPEQLEGKEADARTDIFSFGAILYEMLTSRRPFQGDSLAKLIAAVRESDPEPLSKLRPPTTPALDRLVRKCLQKDPDARWQSAADLADELRWLAARSEDAVTVDPADPRRPNYRRWGVAALSVSGVLLAVTAGAFRIGRWTPSSPAASSAPMRLTITLPPDMPLAPAGLVSPGHDRPALAMSSDGSRLAYVALLGTATRICVRDMQSGTIVPLEHTAGGHTPFFSPDGEWIGFFADSRLKKIPARGGRAIPLADAPNPWGATWGSDGNIYFNRYEGEGIFRVSAAGGAVEPFTEIGLMPEAIDAGSASDQSGEYEEWVTTYPTPGALYKLSQGGGREPMWNPAIPGEVVFLKGRAMYAVDVSRGPGNAGRPQFLFEGAFPDVAGFGYDMARDGRFLMLENKDILKPATTLTIVTNFVEELRRRLPERRQ